MFFPCFSFLNWCDSDFPYVGSQFVKPLPSHDMISGSPQKGYDTSNFSRIILYLRKFSTSSYNV